MAFGEPLAGRLAICACFILAAGAANAQDDVERHRCLEYDQVEAIHRLGEQDMVLEVDGGTTLYHIMTEPRCFAGDPDNDITIEGNGEDNCMRTTDRVHFGRRECGIESFEIIETQDQLDALLAEDFD
jgi:hypothetical protein